MEMKRFFAPDMGEAIRLIRENLGDDAVILSRKNIEKSGMKGIEVLAGIESNAKTKLNPLQEHVLTQQKNKLLASSLSETQSKNNSVTFDSYAQPIASVSTPAFIEDPALTGLRSELSVLRNLLQDQLAGFAWHDASRQQPLSTWLFKQLRQWNLPAECCRRFSQGIQEGTMQEAWDLVQARIQQQLPISGEDIVEKGGIYALLGSTGVGKTTTIAKLAARCAMRHGPDQVVLLTTDVYRVAASEQLRTYGKLLGLKVLVVEDEQSLRSHLRLYKDRHLVLIDTAGMSQRDPRLQQQLSLLNQPQLAIKNYLVLSATHEYHALLQAIKTYSPANLEGVIMTKTDESTSLGPLLGILLEHSMPLSYMTDGQRVPEDCHLATIDVFWKTFLNVTSRYTENTEEHALASDWH
jgi:flagellar biosynthesis protein FlhF